MKNVPGAHDPYEHPPGRVQTISPSLTITASRTTLKNLQLTIQPRKFPPRPLAAAATAAIVECARPRRAACCHADTLLVMSTATGSSRFLHARYLTTTVISPQYSASGYAARFSRTVPCGRVHTAWRPCGFSRNVQACYPSLRDYLVFICYLHHCILPW